MVRQWLLSSGISTPSLENCGPLDATIRAVCGGLEQFQWAPRSRGDVLPGTPQKVEVRPMSTGWEWKAIGTNNRASILETSQARQAADTNRCGMD